VRDATGLDLFAHNPQPAAIMDPVSLRILAVNQAAVDAYGYSFAEFTSMTAADVRPAEDVPPVVERIREIGPSWTNLGEWRHLKKDHTLIDVHLMGMAISYQGTDARLILARDITAEKQAMRAVEENEKKIGSVLESISDPFFTLDREWRFSYLNRHCLPITKRPAAELVGRVIWEAFPQLLDQWYVGFLTKVMRDRNPIHFETPDGEGRFYEVDITPTSDGIALTFREVTERKVEEARQAFLLRLSDRIRGIGEPDDVMWEAVQAVGEFFAVSRATYGSIDPAQRHVIVERDYTNGVMSVAGRHVLDHFGPEVIRDLKRGSTVAIEDVQLDPRSVECAESYAAIQARSLLCVPLVKDGRFVSLLVLHHHEPRVWEDREVALMEDVADRTWHAVESAQAQSEVRRLNQDLERRVAERTAELQAAKDEMEGFCYSVSHDLRTPLRAMMGSAMILIEDYAGAVDDTGKRQLDRLGKNAKRMGDLIDDLLQFSRLGRKEMVRSRVDLTQIAIGLSWDIQQRHPAKRTEFVIEPGMTVEGDPQLLRLVLQNLLENSHKFSQRVDSPRIEFGRDGDAFFVRDNGVGFEPQYSHKLFLPFERLHNEQDYAGTGIGLANVKRIIDRHGGKIWAESQPGHGATFWFQL
jgi:PAS domain S-box-containing protein